MYKINPASYSSVFVLPGEVADRHLRMAGKAQLKVLLWLFRNAQSEYDAAVISRETGVPADEIDDAFYYWTQAGIVIKDGEEARPLNAPEQAEKKGFSVPGDGYAEADEREKSSARENYAQEKPVAVKPSIKDIAARISEDGEIASMMTEAQEQFGRTLGYDAQASLLILHDHYALPASVIIMLCSFARTVGKRGSLAYIMKTGKSWAEEGIVTFEAASKKIARMERAEQSWSDIMAITGAENPKPTSKQAQYVEIWLNDYGFSLDMIELAFERAVEKKGRLSFGYMNGILRSWYDDSIKTPADVERAEELFKERNTKSGGGSRTAARQNKSERSYSIELARRKSMELDPSKTKKGQ